MWPILEDIVGDPDLFGKFALHPEQQYVRQSEQDPTPMRTWEELHHGNDWWYIQVSEVQPRFLLTQSQSGSSAKYLAMIMSCFW